MEKTFKFLGQKVDNHATNEAERHFFVANSKKLKKRHFCTFPQKLVENAYLKKFFHSVTKFCHLILHFVDFQQ